jgi:hypothetical protein
MEPIDRFAELPPNELAIRQTEVRDMLMRLGGYHSAERVQRIADRFQISPDEVMTLLGY